MIHNFFITILFYLFTLLTFGQNNCTVKYIKGKVYLNHSTLLEKGGIFNYTDSDIITFTSDDGIIKLWCNNNGETLTFVMSAKYMKNDKSFKIVENIPLGTRSSDEIDFNLALQKEYNIGLLDTDTLELKSSYIIDSNSYFGLQDTKTNKVYYIDNISNDNDLIISFNTICDISTGITIDKKDSYSFFLFFYNEKEKKLNLFDKNINIILLDKHAILQRLTNDYPMVEPSSLLKQYLNFHYPNYEFNLL